MQAKDAPGALGPSSIVSAGSASATPRFARCQHFVGIAPVKADLFAIGSYVGLGGGNLSVRFPALLPYQRHETVPDAFLILGISAQIPREETFLVDTHACQ